jgi:hypothetical protein
MPYKAMSTETRKPCGCGPVFLAQPLAILYQQTRMASSLAPANFTLSLSFFLKLLVFLMVVAQPLGPRGVPEAAYPVTACQRPSRITQGLHKAEKVSGRQRALRAQYNWIYDIDSNWLYIKRVYPESVPCSIGVSQKGLSKRSLVMGSG